MGEWPRPPVRRYPLVQQQGEAAERQVRWQRGFRIGGSLPRHPLSAIVRLDDIAVDRERETDAIAPADLVVRQMKDALSCRPLAPGRMPGPGDARPSPAPARRFGAESKPVALMDPANPRDVRKEAKRASRSSV